MAMCMAPCALLGAALAFAAARASEDACGRVERHDEIGGRAYMKPSDVKACLMDATLDAATAYHTISHVQHGILDLYSFESIATGSLASEREETAGCEMQVHDVKVDLKAELDKLRVNVMKEVGLSASSDLEALLDPEYAGKPIKSFQFHTAIADMFRRLNDAHTRYIVPWFVMFQNYFYVDRRELASGLVDTKAQRIRFALVPATDGSSSPQVKILKGGAWDTPVTLGPTVISVQVGGESYPAFDWLKEAADKLGMYKSHGARLNALMNVWGDGLFTLQVPVQLPLPPYDSLNFTLEDQSKSPAGKEVMEVDVLVVQGSKTNSTELSKLMNNNPRWTFASNWLEHHLQERGERSRLELQKQALQLAMDPRLHLYDPYHTVEKPKQPEQLPSKDQELKGRRLEPGAGTVVEVARFPELGRAPESFVYQVVGKSTAVLKLTSFMPATGGRQPPMEFFSGIIKLYRKAVETGARRLIVDLVDNGGGVVEAANMMIQLIAPYLDSRDKLCNSYAARLEPFWRDWLDSFGSKWDDVVKKAEGQPTAKLVKLLRQLSDLSMLANGLYTTLPVNTQPFEDLVRKVETASGNEELQRELILGALKARDNILLNSKLVGKDASAGWFPFTGDVHDVHGRDFHPGTKPYFNAEVHKWGKRPSNYSHKFQMACDVPFNTAFDFAMWWMGGSLTGAKHQWDEVAVLTNGLCGSACSMTATKLQMAAGATVFTYGGIPGEQMDVSAFAGGNVEDYTQFWPDVLFSTLIGDTLHGPNTKIGKRLRKDDRYEKTLLLPLPTRAITTFNFNMIFEPRLGEAALPREFYIFPAHKQYSQWIATTTDNHKAPSALKSLYEQIASEDWAKVRKAGGATLGCAALPTTERFHQQWDWGWFIFPPAALLLLCCLSCCWFTCRRTFCKPGVRAPPIVGQPAGMELRSFQP